MKRSLVFVALVLLAVCALWLTFWHPSIPGASAPTQSLSPTPNSRAKNIPHLSRAGTLEGRLNYLEATGFVPDEASAQDWQLAQRTTWWGKPIRAAEFWKGRVVWWDRSAEKAAKAHGRRFPPIPFEDTALIAHSMQDVILPCGGVETPNLNFYGNDKERAFWDSFTRKHPKPPEIIDSKLWEAAARILAARDLSRLTLRESGALQESIKREGVESGYPAEALTPEALFWSYVMHERQEYEKLQAAGWQSDSVPVKNLLRRLAVDAKYICNPLSPNELQAANSWKIAYLQRLQREKTDESYINAYLRAWNLSAAEVFK